MKIETERLNIIALTPDQLQLWTYNIKELEEILYGGGDKSQVVGLI